MTSTERVGVPLIVNVDTVEVAANHPSLPAGLPEELGFTAAKDGCAPSGQCGLLHIAHRRQGSGQLLNASPSRSALRDAHLAVR